MTFEANVLACPLILQPLCLPGRMSLPLSEAQFPSGQPGPEVTI